MIAIHNIDIGSIAWMSSGYPDGGGRIELFYEPEDRKELIDFCSSLYVKGEAFNVIGHTSNIYFTPDFNAHVIVSTRKVRHYEIKNGVIDCDCGVSVKRLAKEMVDVGCKGFEGLIDLPGTIGASIYGNASCFDCSINQLLLSCDYVDKNGTLKTLSKKELKLKHRYSIFKSGELQGVIVSARLKFEKGDIEQLRAKALENHNIRLSTQPGPNNNLGSVFKTQVWTKLGMFCKAIVKLYGISLVVFNKDKEVIEQKKKSFFFKLLKAEDLLPYVYDWNRYFWLDDLSHTLFWKYVRLHQILFAESDFEIEIWKNEKDSKEDLSVCVVK